MSERKLNVIRKGKSISLDDAQDMKVGDGVKIRGFGNMTAGGLDIETGARSFYQRQGVSQDDPIREVGFMPEGLSADENGYLFNKIPYIHTLDTTHSINDKDDEGGKYNLGHRMASKILGRSTVAA